MELTAGSTVTIKVRNPIWPMRKAYASYVHIPEFNEYTGTVIRSHKAIREGQIGLTTGQRDFDMRVIDIDRIVGFESAKSAPAVQEMTWVVKGSKGNEYVVRLEGKSYTCSCLGFVHRHACKHVDEIKAKAA